MPMSPLRVVLPMRAMRALVLALVAACLAAAGPHARAQRQAGVSESAIKAAFVCKFAAYVEWPPQAFAEGDSAIVIGVLGSTTIADEVAQAARGQVIDGRPLSVRPLAPGEPLAGLHVLYVPRTNAARLREMLAAARASPVLTVTESDDGDPMGMINFVVVDNKVRFDVAPHIAEASELRVSARMLGVARRVLPKDT
jgi:hypothetical protein